MKQIDLYIVRKFLLTFLFMNLLLTMVIVIFDISEKIDDFLENSVPFKAIFFDYYLNFIPFMLNMFIGLITFIAVIYFTSRLAFNTEIVAMLAAGISFRRILMPYLVTAFILAGLSFSLSNFIIPVANEGRIRFELEHMNKHQPGYESFVHFQIAPGEVIALQHFDPFSRTGYKSILTSLDTSGVKRVLSAEFIRWDSVQRKWSMEQYSIRTILPGKELLVNGHKLDTALAISPDDLTSRIISVDNLGFRKLRRFIAESRTRGSENILYYEVEKHKRLAYPFATVILTLIGVSLSSRKVRGGIGWHIAMGLLASFSYILFMKFTETFAINGNLPPPVAVWIPNFLYLMLGFWLLYKAPK
ncbi:MAG TPA: LptF/LptG family permease [Bacteroidales bacterium]|nr:LptF/LptG family permease [Bacteroidales bacterium]HRZ49564.1 LptF/LptG family permease [Bacteroidales bacterium]